jgi:hypothetical protein
MDKTDVIIKERRNTMKKIVLTFIVGVLIVGVNAFAAGNLEVTGRIGVGQSPDASSAKLGIAADIRGLMVDLNQNNGSYSTYGIDFSLNRSGSTNLTGDTVSFAANVTFSDTGNRTVSGWIYPVSNNIRYNSSTAGTTTVTSPVYTNAYFGHTRFPNNTRTFNVNSIATNVLAKGHDDAGTGNPINYADYRNIYVKDSVFNESTATSLTGIWVDAISSGSTNSFGIVLDGDGAGSDIVFGPSQEARIYASGGELFAQDGASNVTQISPHDPETGEWIFYSKNTKTGIVKRVNMEKLVKAVEELTGETFMVETIMAGE